MTKSSGMILDGECRPEGRGTGTVPRNTTSRNVALVRAVPMLVGLALAAGLARSQAADSQKWAKVTVDLPVSRTAFPPGNGADIANGQCLICHSAGMVLRQPPLTEDEWTAEINKMRTAFGAPVPADQIAALAKYLQSINGGQQQHD
jgi:mono/diheme cytochrome c family protein